MKPAAEQIIEKIARFNTSTLEARLARASSDHDAAAETANAATATHEKARAEYVANPNDAAGAAVLRARDDAQLANDRLAHLRDIRDAAQGELDAYRAAMEEETARVARAARLAELRETASLEAHRARIASSVAAIVEGEKAIRAGLATIAESYAQSNAAAAELRAEGEDMPKLDELHVLGPIMEARGSVRLDLNPIRYMAFDPFVVAQSLLAGFAVLDAKGGGSVAGHEERLRKELELRLSVRTIDDANALVRRAEEERVAQIEAEREREEGAARVVYVGEDEDDAPSLLDRAREIGTAAASLFTKGKASPELAS